MKTPDFGPILHDLNVLDFNGDSHREMIRSVASLFGGLIVDHGVAAASTAFIGAFPHNPELAEIVRDTSTILISGVSLATVVLTYFHATFALK